MHAALIPSPLKRGYLTDLYLLKLGCRVSLGFVWIWEGLVPKILHPSALQVEMVRRSGLWWGSSETTLHWLGVAMILAGAAIVSGVRERLAALTATLSLIALMFLVIRNEPTSVVDPYGGLAKDACLFACAAVVWILAPITPRRPAAS